MSFQQGLSGLNAAARNLDVIGNNVAQSNTVGAKAARAEFADVYANSLYGASTGYGGIGVMVSGVAQQFTQGDIADTSSPLDMAINGNGFFRMQTGDEITYTRNGQFQLDREGYIINAQGGKLTGYPADANGQVMSGIPGPLQLQMDDLSLSMTGKARIGVNLDAGAVAPDAAVVFDVADGLSYNSATSISVYDSLGVEHNVALYYRKADAPAVGEWDVHVAVDGVAIDTTGAALAPGDAPVAFTRLAFDANGRPADPDDARFDIPVPTTNGAAPLVIPFDLAGSTQLGAPFAVSDRWQDGFGAGRFTRFTVGEDGTIVSHYSNGKTAALGQLVLANFVNPQGLQSIGGNQWIQTPDSGEPLTGTPGAGTLGLIQSSAVEQSTVDLTAELVNMISAQRVYQANAQVIRTHDQLMQTIVNLR